MVSLQRSTMNAVLFLALTLAGLPPVVFCQSPSAARGPHKSDPSSEGRNALYGDVVVLSIGIDNYESPGVDLLNYAQKDARALSEILSASYGYESTLLLDSQATKEAILDKLSSLQGSLGPDSALVVFFAGHGQTVERDSYGREGFLVPYDAAVDLADTSNLEEWRSQAISMREVSNLLVQMKARHVLLMVDACFSGFIGKRSVVGSRPDLELLIERNSRIVLTAGTENEIAIENEEIGHGVFTKALLEQLGKGEAMAASELHIAVRRRVAELSKKRMSPQLRELVIDNGEFVFIPENLTDTEIAEALDSASKLAKSRGARATTVKHLIDVYQAPDYRYSKDPASSGSKWSRKVERLERNASLGDPLAMAALSYYHRRSIGHEPDPRLAFTWARRAYDTGHPAGSDALAWCYDEGVGVPENEQAATYLFKQAAEQGFLVSRFVVLERELLTPGNEGRMVPKEQQAKVLNELTEIAEAGLPSAMVTLGFLGTGVAGFPTNPSLPAKWFAKAIEAGHPDAYRWMSQLYLTGLGVPRDHDKTRELLLKGAELGSRSAQYFVGLGYYGEEPGLKSIFGFNPEEGLRWAKLAARDDYPEAHYLLARMYSDPKGPGRDYAKAREHIENAAAQNYTPALVLEGVWLQGGSILQRNDERAFHLFKEAADLGDADGCFFFARALEEGRGVDLGQATRQEFVQAALPDAIHWYVQAAANEHPAALKKLIEINSSQTGLGSWTWKPALQTFKRRHPESAKVYDRLVAESSRTGSN